MSVAGPASSTVMRRAALGYALVAIAACSWGTWPLILRRAPMPAALQSAILFLVMTCASIPFCVFDRVRARATGKQWLAVAGLGVSDALNVVFFFGAYQRTTVAVAVLTHYLTPIFVAFLAPLVLGERANRRTAFAIGASFVGLVLLLEPWRGSFARTDAVGAGFGAASAVFYATNVVVNKRLAGAFSGSEIMFFHGLVATPLLFVLVPTADYARVTAPALGMALFGAVVPGVLGGLSFVWGLRRIQASHASVLTLLEPFVAVILAAAVLGETLGAVPVVGGFLILGGAVIVVSAPKPQMS